MYVYGCSLMLHHLIVGLTFVCNSKLLTGKRDIDIKLHTQMQMHTEATIRVVSFNYTHKQTFQL
jgi:hypothetical protein